MDLLIFYLSALIYIGYIIETLLVIIFAILALLDYYYNIMYYAKVQYTHVILNLKTYAMAKPAYI